MTGKIDNAWYQNWYNYCNYYWWNFCYEEQWFNSKISQYVKENKSLFDEIEEISNNWEFEEFYDSLPVSQDDLDEIFYDCKTEIFVN